MARELTRRTGQVIRRSHLPRDTFDFVRASAYFNTIYPGESSMRDESEEETINVDSSKVKLTSGFLNSSVKGSATKSMASIGKLNRNVSYIQQV